MSQKWLVFLRYPSPRKVELISVLITETGLNCNCIELHLHCIERMWIWRDYLDKRPLYAVISLLRGSRSTFHVIRYFKLHLFKFLELLVMIRFLKAYFLLFNHISLNSDKFIRKIVSRRENGDHVMVTIWFVCITKWLCWTKISITLN